VDISRNGLSGRQNDAAARAKKKQEEGEELTDEELAALKAEKKRKAEERKERENRISILRGISLRIPLMMYGANVDDNTISLTLDNFTDQIDAASWAEFMPRGVTKQKFNSFRKCYNATVFAAAGRRYRELAREADEMHTEERIQRIAEIFSWFHNPDKETVLTKWRLVNMQLSDCLGGFCFFNERFDGPNQKAVPATNGQLFEWVDTNEPRFVDRGKVTTDIFDDRGANILEINSKTGLYPLYMAYSLYRTRKNDFVANGLIKDVENYSVEEEQVIWDDILMNDIYVVCNTDMAKRITIRTLAGFRYVEKMHVKSDKLMEKVITDRDKIIADIKTLGYWNGTRSKEMIEFKAVVGNPPYQVMDGGNNASAVPVYNRFVDLARNLNPNYISMIMPARWCVGGRGLDDFRDSMLRDSHLKKMFDFKDGSYCFPGGIRIGGGVCYILWDKLYESLDIEVFNMPEGAKQKRPAIEFGLNFLIRSNIVRHMVYNINKTNTESLSNLSWAQKPFGFRTNYIDFKSTGEVKLYTKKSKSGIGYVSIDEVTKNENYIDEWQVVTSRSTSVPEEDNGQVLREVQTFIAEPGSVVTESYIVVASFPEKKKAENCLKYLKTKFFRILCQETIVSPDVSARTFDLVPLQDFTSESDIDWDKSIREIDMQLYKKYDISEYEVKFIEKVIKPME